MSAGKSKRYRGISHEFLLRHQAVKAVFQSYISRTVYSKSLHHIPKAREVIRKHTQSQHSSTLIALGIKWEILHFRFIPYLTMHWHIWHQSFNGASLWLCSIHWAILYIWRSCSNTKPIKKVSAKTWRIFAKNTPLWRHSHGADHWPNRDT